MLLEKPTNFFLQRQFSGCFSWHKCISTFVSKINTIICKLKLLVFIKPPNVQNWVLSDKGYVIEGWTKRAIWLHSTHRVNDVFLKKVQLFFSDYPNSYLCRMFSREMKWFLLVVKWFDLSSSPFAHLNFVLVVILVPKTSTLYKLLDQMIQLVKNLPFLDILALHPSRFKSVGETRWSSCLPKLAVEPRSSCFLLACDLQFFKKHLLSILCRNVRLIHIELMFLWNSWTSFLISIVNVRWGSKKKEAIIKRQWCELQTYCQL